MGCVSSAAASPGVTAVPVPAAGRADVTLPTAFSAARIAADAKGVAIGFRPSPSKTSNYWEEDGLTSEFHEHHILTARLGAGSFGCVFSARQTGSPALCPNMEVAVKVIPLRLRRPNGEYFRSTRRVADAEREAAILERVGRASNCVYFMQAFVEPHFAYIKMELCSTSLLQALQRMPQVTEDVLRRVFVEMLRGIDTVHRAGVVHRDVKPDNFLCSGEPYVVKLCDFGLAERIDDSEAGANLRAVFGTAPFMSPEMLCGDGYGVLTDMWSFAVTCYAMLLGQFPFQPRERTNKAMKEAIRENSPRPTFRPVPGAQPSRASVAFLRRVLQRNPETRAPAGAVLADPWLQTDMGSISPRHLHFTPPCFKGVLGAAKLAGAFTSGASSEQTERLERELEELQVRYHGECVPLCADFADGMPLF